MVDESDEERDGEIRPLISTVLYSVLILIALIGSAVEFMDPSGWIGLLVWILSLFVLIALVSFRLSEIIHWLMSHLASQLISGIVTGNHTKVSYQSQCYEDDMQKARRLVRDEKWKLAMDAYREIVRKAPEKLEPRFELGKVYERLGHLSLAMNEFQKIMRSHDRLIEGPQFVRESERAVDELKRTLSASKVESYDSRGN